MRDKEIRKPEFIKKIPLSFFLETTFPEEPEGVKENAIFLSPGVSPVLLCIRFLPMGMGGWVRQGHGSSSHRDKTKRL